MKTEADLVRGWISKGDSDRAAVKTLMGGEGPYDTACFHAQQAAEKYLKGLIAHRRAPYPKIHDLVELHRIARSLVPTLGLETVDFPTLTAYAVEHRYSADFWPGRSVAEAALATVDLVRAAVLAALPETAHPQAAPSKDP